MSVAINTSILSEFLNLFISSILFLVSPIILTLSIPFSFKSSDINFTTSNKGEYITVLDMRNFYGNSNSIIKEKSTIYALVKNLNIWKQLEKLINKPFNSMKTDYAKYFFC